MEKIRYEIDPHNRLLVKKTGRKVALKRFRKVYDGRFKIGKNNSLIFHTKAPMGDVNVPHQFKFKGKWSLTKNHDLTFTLDKWERQTFGDRLFLKGDIIGVDKSSLVFAVTTATKDNKDSIYLLELQGLWQADKYNRLGFKVKRERSRYDILTLCSSWEVNKNHQVIYQYEKAQLIRTLKKVHTLIFKGYWDIKDKVRISYVLDRDTNSTFNFKTGLGIFKDKYIKYELGTGLSQMARPFKKTIILFGTWKIKKDKGLTFEIDYGDSKIHSISFGVDARLRGNDSISFNLKNENNRDLGADIKLSRKIVKGDGEAFLHLLRSGEEKAIFVGVGKRW